MGDSECQRHGFFIMHSGGGVVCVGGWGKLNRERRYLRLMNQLHKMNDREVLHCCSTETCVLL